MSHRVAHHSPSSIAQHACACAPLVAAVLLLNLACSSDDPGSEGPAGGAGAAAAGGAPAGGAPAGGGQPTTFGGSPSGGSPPASSTEPVGRIDITIKPPDSMSAGATTFIGKFYDAPYPVQNSWKLQEASGGCQLLTPVFPFCDPGCGTSVCVSDDTCVAYPKQVDVGTLSVEGMQAQAGASFMVSPLSETNLTYQPKASVGLTYPGATPGQPVIVRGTSGAYGAFTLQAAGIAPLELMGTGNVRVASGEPTTLSWVPSGSAARVLVELDISHHGGIKGEIVCDVDDTGSLEIPAPLVTGLVDLGVAGFPTIIVTRRSVGAATVPQGRVELLLSSRVERPVEIPGVVSCSGDAECPTGQTCQQDFKCE